MKRVVLIITAALMVFGCSGDGEGVSGGGLAYAEYTPPTMTTYDGWKLTDKDGKRATGAYNESDYARSGNTYTVTADSTDVAKTADGKTISWIASNIAEGDTLIFDGVDPEHCVFYFKDTLIFNKSNITIKGVNGAVLDFKKAMPYTDEQIAAAIAKVKEYYPKNNGVHYLKNVDPDMATAIGKKRGLFLTGTSYVLVENLIIQNAPSAGLQLDAKVNSSTNTYNDSGYNLIRNVECRYNGDSGFQISSSTWAAKNTAKECCENDYYPNGPHDNKFINCWSHDNCDPWNLGENADGFAMKGGTGDYNYFENCISEYNADDGWDCFHIRGSNTLVNCIARYNGINSSTKKVWAEFANGNGFKMGGGSTTAEKTTHRHAQYLKNCIAYGNRGTSGVGFDRNNQYGSIYLENCWSSGNGANLLKWGATTYDRKNYRMGSYGNNIYVKDCYLGQEGEPYDLGYCDGVVNTVAGVK